jgi:hypothetical protein
MTQEDRQAEPEMVLGGDAEEPAPVSEDSGKDASSIPDGSGNDLPQGASPNDDDESFDAG